MSFPGFFATLIVLAIVALMIHHVTQAQDRFARDCAPHMRSVPPEKWHGGNAPVVKMPKGCS